ncbi:MAG: hypothetical protein JWQ43_720 [Glaciihabitans sp.]|nr:hypothetical protein [Glaciihabitans sp.]
MYLREHLHDQLDMIAVLGPADPDVLALLPEAVRTHVLSTEGASLHRRATSRYAWARATMPQVERGIDEVITEVEPGLSTAEIGVAASHQGYATLPISILVSGDRIAMMFPHDLFDGTGGWEHIVWILERATGTLRTDDKTPLRRAVWTAVRHSKIDNREALLAAREKRRHAEVSTSTAPQYPAGIAQNPRLRKTGHRFVMLTPDQVTYLDRSVPALADGTPSTAGRSTRGMKLTELVIGAFSAAVDPAADFRIRMGVDLRRYLPKGVRVLGPFSTAYPIGTLRTTDNSAGALTKRVSTILNSKEPLAALIGDMLGLAKATVRHPLGRPSGDGRRDTVEVTVSIVQSRVPDEFWAEGALPELAVVLLHPIQATSPIIQIADVGGHSVVSIWDETGTVDIDVFEAAISNILAARVLPGSPSGKTQ